MVLFFYVETSDAKQILQHQCNEQGTFHTYRCNLYQSGLFIVLQIQMKLFTEKYNNKNTNMELSYNMVNKV